MRRLFKAFFAMVCFGAVSCAPKVDFSVRTTVGDMFPKYKVIGD